jgi:GxxExxY protein
MDRNEITGAIIGAGMRVSNTLGVGYLEKVYENALTHEIRKVGLAVEQQAQLSVFYDSVEVGHFSPDLLVEGMVIVELKVARAIDPMHEAQLLNYLRATGLHTGLILNFGTPHLGIRRMNL